MSAEVDALSRTMGLAEPDICFVRDVSTDFRGARLKHKRRSVSSSGECAVGEVVPEAERGNKMFKMKFTERTRLR